MAISELLTSTEFVSAIVGAVVGTVGGGLISFWLQSAAAEKAKTVADEDRRDRETALARSLILKLMHVYTDVKAILYHLAPAQALLQQGQTVDLWGPVRPVANYPATSSITTSEMALVLPLGDDEVTNAVLDADRMKDSLVDLMREYSLMRSSLNAKLRPASPNALGRVPIDIRDRREFEREMFELDLLLTNLLPMAIDYQDSIRSALHGAHRVLSTKYRLSFNLTEPSPKRPQTDGSQTE